MICFGEVPSGAVLPIPFDSFAGATGASITLTGLAVTDIEVYKGTSVTQRASDAGYALIDTDGIDLDGITGIHGFSIDTGDNTDAGFYAVGAYCYVVVSAVTIDSQTVNFIAATFRIKAAENTAGYPTVDAAKWNNLATVALPLIPTTAGRTLDVSAGGEAGVDWANVGSPTTVVGLSGTTVKTATDVETDTADIQTRIPAALTGDGNIKADALRINSILPTMGASLTFPTQVASPTNITAGTITTVTNLTNAPTNGDLTATMKASVNTEADTAITDAALATAANLATVDTVVDAILVDTAEIGTAGAGLTALATQASVNTIDDFLDTEVAAILAAVDTEVGAIKTKTDSLTFTVANQIDANVLALNGVTASAANLEKSASVIQRGTVDAGSFSTTTTEFESDDVATAAADHWIGRIVIFTSGTLALQATTITDYAKVGSNGHFTVDALTSIPADNVTFVLI